MPPFPWAPVWQKNYAALSGLLLMICDILGVCIERIPKLETGCVMGCGPFDLNFPHLTHFEIATGFGLSNYVTSRGKYSFLETFSVTMFYGFWVLVCVVPSAVNRAGIRGLYPPHRTTLVCGSSVSLLRHRQKKAPFYKHELLFELRVCCCASALERTVNVPYLDIKLSL